MEEWKAINDYEKYAVSNFGRVKNITTGKILAQSKTNKGYAKIFLRNSTTQKTFLIHRLVSLYFLDEPSQELKEAAQKTKDKKILVNHKDGNKLNNHVDNLEWTDHSKNAKHAYDTGLQTPSSGVINGKAKLDEDEVLEIRKLHKNENGRRGIIKELSIKFNVSPSTVSDIINRITWTNL